MSRDFSVASCDILSTGEIDETTNDPSRMSSTLNT